MLPDVYRTIHGVNLGPPGEVRPLSHKRPTVMVLHSCNPRAAVMHYRNCCDCFGRVGIDVTELHGFDPEAHTGVCPTWQRARVAWTFLGLPQVHRNVIMNMIHPDEWLLVAEDSCKLFAHVTLEDIRRKAAEASRPGVWACYRWLPKTKKRHTVWQFDDPRNVVASESTAKILRPIGSNMFIVKAGIVHSMMNFLRAWNLDYMDTAMGTLRASNLLELPQPLGGSAQHYSLVDGGKVQEEQMPGNLYCFSDCFGAGAPIFVGASCLQPPTGAVIEIHLNPWAKSQTQASVSILVIKKQR